MPVFCYSFGEEKTVSLLRRRENRLPPSEKEGWGGFINKKGAWPKSASSVFLLSVLS